MQHFSFTNVPIRQKAFTSNEFTIYPHGEITVLEHDTVKPSTNLPMFERNPPLASQGIRIF